MERSLLLDPNLDLPRRWGDPVTNKPRLSGERLAEATAVHILDDFIHSGSNVLRE